MGPVDCFPDETQDVAHTHGLAYSRQTGVRLFENQNWSVSQGDS